LRVVASDGDDASEPLESAAFSIPNRPPEIARTPLEVAAGRGLHHTIEARDPDGDKQLRFALVEAPEGASIDPVLGELSWQPRPDQLGTHPIEVVVRDGHGGEANARWEVTVAPTPPASPAPE